MENTEWSNSIHDHMLIIPHMLLTPLKLTLALLLISRIKTLDFNQHV